MTVVEARSAQPQHDDPAADFAANHERIRVRGFGAAEAGELAAAFAAALALVWLIYERLTPLSGGLGFWVCVYVAFLAIAWFVARDGEERDVDADPEAEA